MFYNDFYELANSYYNEDNCEEAIILYDRCIQLYKEQAFDPEETFLVKVLFNKATTMLKLAKKSYADKEFEKEKDFYLKAGSIYKTALYLAKLLNSEEDYAKIYFNLGVVYNALKKYKQAHTLFLIADKLYNGIDEDTKKVIDLYKFKNLNLPFKNIC